MGKSPRRQERSLLRLHLNSILTAPGTLSSATCDFFCTCKVAFAWRHASAKPQAARLLLLRQREKLREVQLPSLVAGDADADLGVLGKQNVVAMSLRFHPR